MTGAHSDPPGTAPPLPEMAAASGGGVFLTPLRGGALPGFVLLVLLAAALSWTEGGVGDDAWLLLVRPLLLLAAAVVLAVYAHRVVLCALEGDRGVPWFRDDSDESPWTQNVGTFAIVMIASLGPAAALSLVLNAARAPAWVGGVVALVAVAFASVHFPFALASSALRRGALGAGYIGTWRAWRADPVAARTATAPSAAFFGLLVVSFLLAQWLVRPLRDVRETADHTTARDFARGVVFVTRAAAVWTSFCTFRAAGRLARDVPAIREALA